jgi:hypothetical protein
MFTQRDMPILAVAISHQSCQQPNQSKEPVISSNNKIGQNKKLHANFGGRHQSPVLPTA